MPPFHCTMVSWHGIMAWMKGRKPDFAKTQGQKIRFGVCFYLDESSEADIQPSLYNQTFSTILKASKRLQNFMFLRISHFRFSVFNFDFPIWDFRKFHKTYGRISIIYRILAGRFKTDVFNTGCIAYSYGRNGSCNSYMYI